VELDKIRNGDQRQIETIYNNHRSEFISWIVKLYHCSYKDAGDIYHYSVLAFYENVVSNKLKVLECSIKTYLFAIGRKKYLELLKSDKKFVQNDNERILINLPEVQKTDALIKEQQLECVEKGLDKLGEPGRTILELYYYHGKSMEEIAELLNYKNSATAKNLKYKSLLRLRKICQEEQKKAKESMYYE
jgi:RNA polymerase sigma factor (sigma-70 family)